ncbi:aldo/keto reductase [Enterococcus alishanensis]
MELRRFGGTELKLSPLGLGTWQFSNNVGIGARFWKDLSYEKMKEIVQFSLDQGINWLDTAEAYGNGTSEKNIGKILSELEQKPYLADKWWPFMRSAKSIGQTIDQRLELLQINQISLHQIHHPTSFSSIERQMDQMCQLIQKNKIQYVGVSNFSANQMKKAEKYLRNAGAKLVSNQVRYNLIDRRIEDNGVLALAKELNVAIIAYSPLHQGLLTGKYHDNPQQLKQLFWLKKFQYGLTEKNLKKTQLLVDHLVELGQKHQKTPAQIALNWLINVQGETVFAIPGASSLGQVKQNVAAANFRLSQSEISSLSGFK